MLKKQKNTIEKKKNYKSLQSVDQWIWGNFWKEGLIT